MKREILCRLLPSSTQVSHCDRKHRIVAKFCWQTLAPVDSRLKYLPGSYTSLVLDSLGFCSSLSKATWIRSFLCQGSVLILLPDIAHHGRYVICFPAMHWQPPTSSANLRLITTHPGSSCPALPRPACGCWGRRIPRCPPRAVIRRPPVTLSHPLGLESGMAPYERPP